MIYRGYNDYELLYLAKEQNEEALNLLFQKYDKLIIKKAHSFKNIFDLEDLCQEGKMILNKAIQTFDELYNKTFTRYFEMLIEHRFIDLVRKRQRELKNIEIDNEKIESYQLKGTEQINSLILNEMIDLNYRKLSEFEQQVFEYKYLRNMKVLEISNYLDTYPVNISNALQRIKKKIKK